MVPSSQVREPIPSNPAQAQLPMETRSHTNITGAVSINHSQTNRQLHRPPHSISPQHRPHPRAHRTSRRSAICETKLITAGCRQSRNHYQTPRVRNPQSTSAFNDAKAINGHQNLDDGGTTTVNTGQPRYRQIARYSLHREITRHQMTPVMRTICAKTVTPGNTRPASDPYGQPIPQYKCLAEHGNSQNYT